MSADIDIDFADRNQLLELIQHTPELDQFRKTIC